ncbi:MAG: hypothetical protein ABS75_19835 [Pelagibacterium sp. SCN 63-23]|nr:MAG: hypothetical protein ABS75_19835 [Pelagibacterium sp. SCN 63-23]
MSPGLFRIIEGDVTTLKTIAKHTRLTFQHVRKLRLIGNRKVKLAVLAQFCTVLARHFLGQQRKSSHKALCAEESPQGRGM